MVISISMLIGIINYLILLIFGVLFFLLACNEAYLEYWVVNYFTFMFCLLFF